MTLHFQLTGGLGNQLFQVAAMFEVQKKYGKTLHYRFRSTGKTLRMFEIEELCNTLGFRHCRLKCNLITKKYRQHEGKWDSFDFLKVKDNSAVYGYFQSHKYHETVAEEFKSNILELKPECSHLRIPSVEAIGIHLRLGDYYFDEKAFQVHGVLERKYYLNAVNRILDSNSSSTSVNVITDSPVLAAKLIEDLDREFGSALSLTIQTCSERDSLCDLKYLAAHKRLVLSNSSFSWWGGSLASKAKIVAPLRWYRDESYQRQDLLLPSWLTLENQFEIEFKT